jgi:putative endonuclease
MRGAEMAWNQEVGAAGESAAAAWYERNGFVVVVRNWRGKAGELDLVVSRSALLVICEVKTRSSSRFGGGAEAVGVEKQRRIRRLAGEFLNQHRWQGDVRFDVAVVTRSGSGGRSDYAVDIITAAF